MLITHLRAVHSLYSPHPAYQSRFRPYSITSPQSGGGPLAGERVGDCCRPRLRDDTSHCEHGGNSGRPLECTVRTGITLEWHWNGIWNGIHVVRGEGNYAGTRQCRRCSRARRVAGQPQGSTPSSNRRMSRQKAVCGARTGTIAPAVFCPRLRRLYVKLAMSPLQQAGLQRDQPCGNRNPETHGG